MKMVLICISGAALAGCATVSPSAQRAIQQKTPDEVVSDLLHKGSCDDAWFYAVHVGSQPLIDRVDAACRLKPGDVVR
jgi:hypothetical protein